MATELTKSVLQIARMRSSEARQAALDMLKYRHPELFSVVRAQLSRLGVVKGV